MWADQDKDHEGTNNAHTELKTRKEREREARDALSDIIVIISKEMAAASSRNYSPATQKKRKI